MYSFSLQLSVHMVIPAHLGLEAGEPSAQGRADWIFYNTCGFFLLLFYFKEWQKISRLSIILTDQNTDSGLTVTLNNSLVTLHTVLAALAASLFHKITINTHCRNLHEDFLAAPSAWGLPPCAEEAVKSMKSHIQRLLKFPESFKSVLQSGGGLIHSSVSRDGDTFLCISNCDWVILNNMMPLNISHDH